MPKQAHAWREKEAVAVPEAIGCSGACRQEIKGAKACCWDLQTHEFPLASSLVYDSVRALRSQEQVTVGILNRLPREFLWFCH